MIVQEAYDAALEHLADNGDKLVLCTQEPADFTAADGADKVAETSLATGAGGGDWTVQAGDAGGEARKLTLAAQTVTGTADGTATHYAILDTATNTLLYANTMTNVEISNGVDQDTQAVDVWEIQEPA